MSKQRDVSVTRGDANLIVAQPRAFGGNLRDRAQDALAHLAWADNQIRRTVGQDFDDGARMLEQEAGSRQHPIAARHYGVLRESCERTRNEAWQKVWRYCHCCLRAD